MDEVKPFNILIDIDAMLDMRISAMAANKRPVDSELLEDHELYEKYITRQSDSQIPELFGVRPGKYKKWLTKLTPEHVTKATRTCFNMLIAVIISEVIRSEENSPVITNEFTLTVNTYPFRPTGTTLETLSNAILELCKGITDVKFVCLSPDDLDYKYIVNNYSTYIIYKLHDWFKAQKESIEGNPEPAMNIIAPRLYENQVPTIEDLSTDTTDKSPFEVLEYLTHTVMNLQFMEPRFFSYKRMNLVN